MQQRLPSLLDPPIMFARRGASAHAPENTVEAFELALRLGATGIGSDVRLTADEVPVLAHGADVRIGRFRRRAVAELRRDELPGHVPTLDELIDVVTRSTPPWLSLDVPDAVCGRAVIDALRDRSSHVAAHTWLCHGSLDVLTELRRHDDEIRLVNTTRLDRIDEGPERRAARLAAAAIDAIELRQPDWNGGLAVLFHRFERAAFGRDVQHEHHLRPAFRMGLDAISGDHVDRMVDAFTAEIGSLES